MLSKNQIPTYTVMFPAPLITTGSGVKDMFGASRIDEFSS